MVLWQGQPKRLLFDSLRSQGGGILNRQTQEGNINPAFPKSGELFAGTHVLQIDVNVRTALRERTESIDQNLAHPLKSADRKVPDFSSACARSHLRKTIHLAEYLISMSDNYLASFRQANLSLRSMENLDPQFLFGVLDLQAQRRLTDVQADGCTAKAQLFCDRDDIS